MVTLLTQLYVLPQPDTLIIFPVHYWRTLILVDNNMSNKMSCQCPNCERLFSNQRSLKLHVPSCCRRHLPADNDTHHQLEHHPLRSFCYVNDTSSFNKDGDSEGDRNDYNNDDSDISDFILAESGVCSDDYNNVDWFLNNYEEAQGQQSTVASKLQIKLNHLINSHNTPLKLYNDIVYLFNEYVFWRTFQLIDFVMGLVAKNYHSYWQ